MWQVFKDFKEFLKEYKIIGLAVAFVMGIAATALVQSLVNDMVMPAITPFIPGGEWKSAVWNLGPIVLKWGSFLGALINFIVIALVIFVVVEKGINRRKHTEEKK